MPSAGSSASSNFKSLSTYAEASPKPSAAHHHEVKSKVALEKRKMKMKENLGKGGAAKDEEDALVMSPVGPKAADAPSLKYKLGIGEEDDENITSDASSADLLSEVFASTESVKGTSTSSSGPPVDSILTDPPTGTNNGTAKFVKSSSFQSLANSSELAEANPGLLQGLPLENQAFQLLAAILLLHLLLFFVSDYLFKV